MVKFLVGGGVLRGELRVNRYRLDRLNLFSGDLLVNLARIEYFLSFFRENYIYDFHLVSYTRAFLSLFFLQKRRIKFWR